MNEFKFQLDVIECKAAVSFMKKHKKCHKENLGSLLEFTIVPTGIGDSIQLTCKGCGAEANITNINNW